METDKAMRPSADELNAILAAGGYVQITTRLVSTLYKQKHAGMFFEKAGSLYVKRGKHADCLATPGFLLVSIRTKGVKS